ncbi:butyrate kinase [Listeria costaricensis]|uniref:butyrate kinase n=1 Tax=Listeria costaricensis TaxID=2026604 RepID=UPI000C075073|nr:butyrate kinase [Listeria costaricensis]
MAYTVLTINPGSTSTKLAVFEGDELQFEEEIRHSREELKGFKTILEQLPLRREVLLRTLSAHDFDLKSLDAIVGRGGLLRPMEGGTYRVNDKMVADLRAGVSGEHASNLGGLLAKELAEKLNGLPAFIVDPVVVDELAPVARFSGHKNYERISIFHALNHKASARKIAAHLGTTYEEVNFVIAHLGGGISVAAHQKGRAIDVNNALDGEGPFSPERSGSLPMAAFLEAAMSGQWTKQELYQQLIGQGGVISYLDTNDMRVVEEKIAQQDTYAKEIFEAMAYQVAKEIGQMAVVLQGQVEAIILTGGLARSKNFTEQVKQQVSWIGPVFIHPGADELEALNSGAQRVLAGMENAKDY